MTDFSQMKIIGLTGMSGAGKTTACEIFSKNGFSVISGDSVAIEVCKSGSVCLEEIKERFDMDIIDADGKLDRKKTAGIIFNNPKKKIDYEKIIFPFITYKVLKKIIFLRQNNINEVLLDAPTLFESGIDKLCTAILSIVADNDITMERIIKRDRLTPDEAGLRLSSQKDENFYISKSDYSIKNNNNTDELQSNIQLIIKRLRCINVND